MKTGMLFGIVFWLGVSLLLATAGLQLYSAVWHEERIQTQQVGQQVKTRLVADQLHGETIAKTNSNLGWPGIIMVLIGSFGWFFRPLPRRGKKLEDFPGRANPELFNRLRKETSEATACEVPTYDDGYRVSRR